MRLKRTRVIEMMRSKVGKSGKFFTRGNQYPVLSHSDLSRLWRTYCGANFEIGRDVPPCRTTNKIRHCVADDKKGIVSPKFSIP